MFSRPVNWLLIFIILLAMLLRVAVFMPLVQQGLTPVFDEVDYFERAAGLTAVLGDIARLQPVDGDNVQAFFGVDPFKAGWWPPLQMGLISFSALLPAFDDTATRARFVTILLSTLTVPVVYLVARACFGRRNAYLSAFIFAVYPSFVAFSHYLWSETLYILLQFLLLYFAFSAADSRQARRGLGLAVAAGLTLGLAGLTRSSALVLFGLTPLWLLVARMHRMAPTTLLRQLKLPGVVLLTSVLVVLPWEVALFQQQGQIAPLSNSGGYNLYIGSSERFIPVNEARAQIMAYAADHSLSWDAAARDMALHQIREDPRQFAEITGAKFRRQWSGETFILRHLFQVIYPPASPWTATAATAYTQFSFILLLAVAAVGAMAPGKPGWRTPLRLFSSNRGLLLAAAVLSALFALLAIANTRLVLPVVALLIPFASHGLWSLVDAPRRRKLLLGGLAVVVAILLHTNIVLVNRQYPNLRATSYYQNVVAVGRPYLGTAMFNDHIMLRDESGASDSYEIELLSDEYELVGEEKQRITWTAGPDAPPLSIRLRSPTAEGPVQIRITNTITQATQTISPIMPEAWQTWVETSLPGVAFRWTTIAE